MSYGPAFGGPVTIRLAVGNDDVTVLVVDDDPTVRQVLHLMLDLEGCRVVLASDGTEALSVAETVRPDVVLLDVEMPSMDGMEVCRRLKDGGEPPQVFMVSAMDTLEHEHQALLAGADGFLRKPFSPLKLLSIVDSAADGPNE